MEDIIDKNIQDELFKACKNGSFETVYKILISTNSNVEHLVNQRDNQDNTPLIWASTKGHLEIVELLLSKGADINAQDKDGYTSLLCATMKGNEEIARLLVSKKADMNLMNKHGETALIFAINRKHFNIAELLIESGSDVNIKDKDGDTALINAIHFGHIELVNLLIHKQANLNSKNNKEETSLSIAQKKGFKEIAELLISNGAVNTLKNNEITNFSGVEENNLNQSEINQINEVAPFLNSDNEEVLTEKEISEIEVLKKKNDWFIEVIVSDLESHYYNSEEFIDKLKTNIIDGIYQKEYSLIVYLKTTDGDWQKKDYTIETFAKTQTKLNFLYKPFWEHATIGFKWGIIVGVILKLLDTTIGLYIVDPTLAFLFVVAIGVCFIPRIGTIGFIIAIIAINKISGGYNFFFMSIISALTGGILGCLPGLTIGGIVGFIRKSKLPLAKDANPEPKYYLYTLIIIPLLASIGLILFYFFIFNPWLLEFL